MRLKRRLQAAFGLLLVFAAQLAFGANPPEVDKGLAWLNAQVQATGAVSGESGSAAAAFQVRSEALFTLKQLGAAPGALVDVVASEPRTSVEYLARSIHAQALAGRDVSALIQTLPQLQNADGGFGAAQGYASNPLDTAYVLLALNAANHQSVVSNNAVVYLAQTAHADQGYGFNGDSAVYPTAYALLALALNAQTQPLAARIQATRAFLVNSRTGTAYATTMENAVAALALTAATSDSATFMGLQDALKAGQAANGSWGDDPFLTALAIRALAAMASAPPAPSTGEIAGTVVDDRDGTGLAGAAVQVTGVQAATATSGANGAFALSGLAAGSYTGQISKAGYATATFTATVVAGSGVNLGTIRLAIASTTATVQGQVIDGSTSQPLAGVTIAVSGGANATTDASGNYSLAGLLPGAVTITASKSGYQSATANASLNAGTITVFSPSLYALGQTPTDATLKGKVVNATTSQPLLGATVKVGAASTSTNAAGEFQLTGLATGAASIEVSAAGFRTGSFGATLALGMNDAGSLQLSPAPQSFKVSGKVSERETNLPLGGASVKIAGTALSAFTNANGHYEIAGLTALQFAVQVEAPGFASATTSVTLNALADTTVDVLMDKVRSNGLAMKRVSTNLPVYPPYTAIEVEAEVENTNATPADLLFVVTFFDAQGVPIRQDQGVAATIPANRIFEVEIDTHNANEAPGQYSVQVRGYNMAGQLQVEGSASFQISALTRVSGGVDLNPPIVQSGVAQAVAIQSAVHNYGNQPVPAGQAQLTITLDAPDSQIRLDASVTKQQLLAGSPINNAGGAVSDPNGNLFVLSRNDRKIVKVAANGDVTTFGPLTGQFPLAGAMVADAANVYVLGIGSVIHKVNSMTGAMSTINTGVSQHYAFDRDADGNFILAYLGLNGAELAKLDAAGNRTLIVGAGLSNPQGMAVAPDGTIYVTNFLGDSISRVDTSGRITQFASGVTRPRGVAVDAAGNIFVVSQGLGGIVKFTPNGARENYATGLTTSIQDVAVDKQGNLYVTNLTTRAISKILPNRTVVPFAQSVVSQPQGLQFDAAGDLVVAGASGAMVKLDRSDNVTSLASSLSTPRGLAIGAGGEIFVANQSTNSVTRTANGSTAPFTTGFVTPMGVTFGPNGKLYVAEFGANRISLAEQNLRTTVAESLVTAPVDVHRAASGDKFILNAGSLAKVSAAGVGSVVASWTFTAVSFVPNAAGGFYVQDSSTLKTVTAAGAVSTIPGSFPSLAAGIALDSAGNLLVVEKTSGIVRQVNPSTGALTQFATLMSPFGTINTIASDGAGGLYTMNTFGQIQHVSAGKVVTVFATVSNGVRMSVDTAVNKMFVTTSAGISSLDLGTKASQSLIPRTSLAPIHAVGGQIFTADTDRREFVTYTQQGAMVDAFAGFHQPAGIAWDGNTLLFSAGPYVYTLTPGGLPRILSKNQMGAFLTVSNGVLYGSQGKTLKALTIASPEVAQNVYTLEGAFNLSGIAVRGDGIIAIGSDQDSRIVFLNPATKTLVASYAGILPAAGIGVNAAGQVFIGSSNQIVRIEPSGKQASVVADGLIPSALTLDGSDRLHVAVGSGTPLTVYRFDMQGNRTEVAILPSNAGGFNGLAVNAAGRVFVLSGTVVRALEPTGNLLQPYAAGIASPTAVRVGPGGYYVASQNGTILKIANGAIDLVEGGYAGITDMAVTASGRVYFTQPTGILSVVDANGLPADLLSFSIHGQTGSTTGYLGPVSGETLALAHGNNLVRVSTTYSAPVPPAGTVVHTATLPMHGIAVSGDPAKLDFGSWTPQYPGDYTVRIKPADSGVAGELVNHLHVGSGASGKITAAKSSLPPGNPTVNVALKVSGADFLQTAKVQTSAIALSAITNVPNMRGMGIDASGNIYFVHQSLPPVQIKRLSPSGVITPVYSEPGALAYVFMGQIPVDDANRLYIPSAKDHNKVLRIDLGTGAAETYATIAEQVQSIALDKGNRLYILTKTKLHRMDAAGALTTIMNLPAEGFTITLDGRDNLYMQLRDNSIWRIRPDGNAVALLPAASVPSFEYEGVAIAGDCADNVFMLPVGWDKYNQSGEEYMLLQMIGRTGKIGHVLDGRQINSDLYDIDFIIYDRFSESLVMWTDLSGGRVYRIPVTCGTIDTDVHVVLSASQQAANFSIAPKAVIAKPGGDKEYVWSLNDVTVLGKAINYDTTLSGLKLGDVAPLAKEAFLTFKNTFVPGEVRVPIAVPTVNVDGMVDLGITTDQNAYPANTAVQTSVVLDNRFSQERTGNLMVEVTDAQGVRLTQIAQQSVSIAAGGVLTVTPPFNTGATLAGFYRVKAVLTDPSSGAEIARGEAGFDIVAPNQQLVSSVNTDKQAYEASDVVNITGRVRNVTLNAFASNLRVQVSVKTPGGAVHAFPVVAIAQLPPTAFRDTQFTYRLNAGTSGTYTVELRLVDSADNPLDVIRTAQFSVLSTADTGTGLRGALAMTQLANEGDLVSLAGTVKNQGNDAINNLALTFKIVNPQNQQVVQAWPATLSLPKGDQQTVSQSWNTASAAAGTYAGVFTATVGGREIVLGQDVMTLGAVASFAFTAQTGVQPNTAVVSNTVTVSGIVAPVTISVTGGEYSVNGGAYRAMPSSVKAGDTVSVRVTSASAGNTTVAATLTIGTTSADFEVTTRNNDDTSPDAFSFAPQSGVPLNTLVASNTVTITGINTTVPIGVTGGEYSVNGGAFTTAAGTVQSGDTVTVRVRSSTSYSTASGMSVTVSGVSASFTVTTLEADTSPDAFTFASRTDVALDTFIVSNIVTIAGINTPVPIKVTGGEYSINGGAFTAADGQIKAGDTLAVRVRSSTAYKTAASMSVTVSAYATSFTVTTAATPVPDVSHGFTRDARVLVLVACDSGGPAGANCVAARKAFLETYFTQLGIEHKVVTSGEAFKEEFRCGRYNTYWLSGKIEKLKDTLVPEIRAAVFRGDALVVDGEHDNRNGGLEEVLGVKFKGKPNNLPKTVVLASSYLPAGTFSIAGDAMRVELQTATRQAHLGTPSGEAAIVANAYGQGQAMQFAFDFVGTLYAASGNPLLKSLVEQALGHVAPVPSSTVTAGAYVALNTQVKNTSATSQEYEVAATLPSGMTFVSSVPSATLNGAQVKWRLTIPAGNTTLIDWAVHAPNASGSYTVPVTIGVVDGSNVENVGNSSFTVTVNAASTAIGQTVSALQAMALPNGSQRNARDKAVTSLQTAQTKLGQSQYETAIAEYVAATGELDKITSVSTANVETAIAKLMQEAGRQNCDASLVCGVSNVAPTAYSVTVFGSASLSNGEAYGSIGVGGALSLSSYTAASRILGDSAKVVTGGSLTWSNGSVGQDGSGVILVGGAASVGQNVGRRDLKTGVTVEDWNALKTEYQTLTDSLAAKPGQAAVLTGPNQYRCAGTDTAWNVCTITATQLTQARGIDLQYPNTASVLVNVTGGAVTLSNGQMTWNGQALLGHAAAKQVILNFPGTGAITVNSFGLGGTFLAPRASVSHSNGAVDGTIVVNGLSSTGSYRCSAFTGTVQ